MKELFVCVAFLIFAGCASSPYNYRNFQEHPPRSILVLPPVSESTDLRGTYGYLSTVSFPVAEKGYYVFPVAVIDQMMKENGVYDAYEAQQISLKKIEEIINPDAVLYLRLINYGTKYYVVGSDTTVTVAGKLVDIRSGITIWEGHATATETSGGNGMGALANALVYQIVNSTTDKAHQVSYSANANLFWGQNTGLLDGPYRKRDNY